MLFNGIYSTHYAMKNLGEKINTFLFLNNSSTLENILSIFICFP